MTIIATDAPNLIKFSNPTTTASGEPRAQVELVALQTLWFNTGTLCNLACESCYIESSPSNDALLYLSRDEVAGYLSEIDLTQLPVQDIGITGGEPFMNPDILGILEDCLTRGYQVLVLTNAMRPMQKCAAALLALRERFPTQLEIRVSIDHYEPRLHEQERGKRSWAPMHRGVAWLVDNGFNVSIAGRMCWQESETAMREGFATLFSEWRAPIDASDPQALVLFPEMDPNLEVPEITTGCWTKLGVDPTQLMCASARMVVKPKASARPKVVACTLLPYAEEFTFQQDLASSLQPVRLNHKHCATFCVLGGATCSG